ALHRPPPFPLFPYTTLFRSERFELITLPGGDSIRVTAASPALPGRPATGGRGGAAAGLNYPLYQALGADFAVGIGVAADTTVLTDRKSTRLNSSHVSISYAV